MSDQVVRRLTISATSTGIDEQTGKLNKLADASNNVAQVTDTNAKRALSAKDALAKLTNQIDDTARAQAQIEKGTRTLNAALAQGIITQDQYNNSLALLNAKYGEVEESSGKAADGLVIFNSEEKETEYSSYYVQFYPNGIVEAVDREIMAKALHSSVIPGTAVEQAVLSLTLAVLDVYRLLGLNGRVWLAVSIVGELEYKTVSYDKEVSRGPAKIGKQHRLILPPIIFDMEEATGGVVVKLSTVFDALAHAGGWDESPNKYFETVSADGAMRT
ncbi:hypothetical protein [Bradyrhizobium sp. McL0615]|uniref:hypothetical protein n=1 Tax=Bradyrhizobium sp. McL0615 TaxID=3415673 RepID=UPI003CEE249F